MSSSTITSNPTILAELAKALAGSIPTPTPVVPGFTWNLVPAPQALDASANNAYYSTGIHATNAFNLPLTAAVGDTYSFVNMIDPSATPYQGKVIIQMQDNKKQQIVCGPNKTSTGGSGSVFCMQQGVVMNVTCVEPSGALFFMEVTPCFSELDASAVSFF